MKEKLLISACLMGDNVKYNGSNNKIDIEKLEKEYTLISFCPEVEGGLPIPRPPAEMVCDEPLKLINIEGKNVTKEFILGAKKAVMLAQQEGITKALLKAKSPSCGKGEIYDGTFLGVLREGDGVTVRLLEEIGVKVYNENNW
ncbi:MAG: DUF523 domain-containing protein [Sulfurovum sp.]|nr:MAG: DUF523 domain-containing protein [Sulfurovum sp.]